MLWLVARERLTVGSLTVPFLLASAMAGHGAGPRQRFPALGRRIGSVVNEHRDRRARPDAPSVVVRVPLACDGQAHS
jgi:hypothetical protein